VKGLLVVLLICGSWWWFWGRADGAVKVIEAQLQAIDNRDYTAAYGYLSTDAKAAMTAEDFQERVQKSSVVTNHANTKFFSRSIDNDVATISGTIEALDNSKIEARYILIKEGNRWVIQSFSFK
jgi:uncharacterized protein DUF4864